MAEKIIMTALSPTMEEGLIIRWNKREGDTVSSGDVLCEVETDKASMEYESFQEGVLLKILLGEGEKCKVGRTIAVIGQDNEDISGLLNEVKSEEQNSGSPAAEAKKAQSRDEQDSEDHKIVGNKTSPENSQVSKIKASPLAKKLAKENFVDLKHIAGSGPNGRIVKRDIEEILASSKKAMKQKPLVVNSEDLKVPLSGTRKVIASRLAESKFSAPHFYLSLSINMKNVLEAREKLNSQRENKISLNAFLVKIAAQALSKHPFINSSWQGDSILMRGTIDIALAVEKEDGLITPVVRNCYQKGLVAIDKEFSELIQKARENKLSPEEYQNAGFTISNLGSYGIEDFTAIINPPGSAILAVGKIMKTPVVNEQDQIEVQAMMKVTLSCDHRVIDGALGARFLKDFKEMIENPISALY
ncbi:MAG: pyruvate dehydrogenase complex dihydrolipoamide acetyltransferase [Spirochaetales bacterium]|nr:pyruvate dehydrogenase complex dihydrolipoamide acetyltransferase [Spirochaetales bacterium]